MSGWFLRRALFAALAGAAPAVAGAAPAVAAPVRVERPHPISGRSQFTGACPGMFPVTRQDAEGEPILAVNPLNPRNIVAAWTQDTYTQPAVATSLDGGRTFRPAKLQRATTCTGGTDKFSLDPWVSFGRDGRSYVTVVAGDATGFPVLSPMTRVLAYRSANSGLDWRGPTVVEPADGSFYDKPSVTADPKRRGRVYVVYARRTGPQDASTGIGLFRQTRDGGRSYGPRARTSEPGAQQFPDAAILSVLPDGSLLNVFIVGRFQRAPLQESQRSRDGGRTWSPPALIGTVSTTQVTDPDTGQAVQSDPLPSVTVGAHGVVYVTWHEVASAHSSRIALSRSRNGGRSWSRPATAISSKAQVFLPTIAAAPDGTLALTWYDTRRDKPGDGQLTTDYWFARSRDDGRTWIQAHVDGPFDPLQTSSTGPAHFIGDYFGLAAVPGGFVTAYTMGPPRARVGPSDIFFTRIHVAARARPRLRLVVAPQVVGVGRTTRLRLRVTSRTDPVRGARVSLGRHAARTDSRGRATLTVVLRRAGGYRVRVTRRGYRAAATTLRARGDRG